MRRIGEPGTARSRGDTFVTGIATAIAANDCAHAIGIWRIGNAGVIVKFAGRTLAIDPWLSSWLETPSTENPEPVRRMRAAPMTAAELVALVDGILVTHEHPDHLDPGLVADIAEHGVPVVVPDGCVATATALGMPEPSLRAVSPGDCVDIAGFSVHAVPAVHAFAPGSVGGYTRWTDDKGLDHAVGYVIRAAGRSVFHSGDTVMSPGLDGILLDLAVDTCLLPINGRDWLRESRGLVGNLTARESADLAHAAGAAAIVPMHYDGVVGNTASPAELVDYAFRSHPDLAVHVLDGSTGLFLPAIPPLP